MKRLHQSSSGSTSATPSVRLASSAKDQAWFDAQLDSFHDLGATMPIGDFLRQIVEIDSKPVALLAWGPACYALKDRDRWISCTASREIVGRMSNDGGLIRGGGAVVPGAKRG